VLENLDFSIARGDFLGIIGPNGSGKTTLLRCILGELRPLGGRISVSPRVRFGYVVQRQALDDIFPFTVRRVVEMGRYGRLGLLKRLGREDNRVIDECLTIVGLERLGGSEFRSLSGGQKQRVLIARALAADPDVMLLDEPTNDLDVSGETQIMDLIHEIHHNRGITVIMVSHLLHVVLNHVEKLLFLRERELTLHKTSAVVDSDFLSNLYGQHISVSEMNGRRVILTEERDGDIR
jgi:ABC-type Mn2+/Zn2+ transport system ATPase subunit